MPLSDFVEGHLARDEVPGRRADMSRIAWYPIAVFLVVATACCAWMVVASLRRRRLEVGPAIAGLVCLGILYILWPLVLPPDPPPPDADGFTLRYDVRTRATWIPPVLLILGVLLGAGTL